MDIDASDAAYRALTQLRLKASIRRRIADITASFLDELPPGVVSECGESDYWDGVADEVWRVVIRAQIPGLGSHVMNAAARISTRAAGRVLVSVSDRS